MCSETGETGRSVPCVGQILGRCYALNFPLRSSPRITVRGQTVQGVRLVLRKAPLPSRMCPWSTRRHCGPLAFRRATEGSRVLRRVWGVKRGAREPYGALAPFLPRRRAAASSPVNTGTSAAEGGHLPAVGTASPPPDGGISQNPVAGSGSAQIPRVFSTFHVCN